MEYQVGSLKFKTQAGLIRALKRNGASDAWFTTDEGGIIVLWPEANGETVQYRHKLGVFEDQLAWDVKP